MRYIAVMAQWKEDFTQAVLEHSGVEEIFMVMPRPPATYQVTIGDITYQQVKQESQLKCLRGIGLCCILVSEEIRDVLSDNDFNNLYEQLNRKLIHETT